MQKHTKPSLNLDVLYLQEDTTSYTLDGTREFFKIIDVNLYDPDFHFAFKLK